MNNGSPFLDVKSFVTEDTSLVSQESSTPLRSPFLAIYELEAEGSVDPQTEEYVSFLNELYDEQFNEVLSSLVDEAVGVYQSSYANEHADSSTSTYQADRLLTQHFTPLVSEAESMIRAVAAELGKHDPNTLSEEEVEGIVDSYRPSNEINPQFEEWFGGLLKKVVNVAKSAAGTIAKWGLGPILNKLLALVKPLLKKVTDMAIDRLPIHLQPMAKMLRDKVPFLKEFEEYEGYDTQTMGTYGVKDIQNEFNQQVANLLFAQTETEQDLEVAHASNPPGVQEGFPLAELEAARERLVEGLMNLKDGEDPTPQVENFIPALIPVLKVGLKLAGRGRVVNFLANFLSKLIVRFVGPSYAGPLSKAIVDAGLRLLQLETPQNEARAAASAVAATIEETVQRVAALPEFILDNQELLEGATLEAFEQAAAANLPPVLSDDTYRKRPELRDHHQGFWHRYRRYKKHLGPKIMASISPYKLASLETFDGSTVGEALEEQYAIAPGEELQAEVHLYEAIPGTRLSDIARGEEVISKVEGENWQSSLHPLTHDAAALLLDQPELGRDAAGQTGDPTAPQVGQRFYYLEIPGKRPLMATTPDGRAHVRHRSRLRLDFVFPKNEIVARIYLSEIRSQRIAVELRRNGHTGMIIQRLRPFIQRRVDRTFSHVGKLKIIHGAVIPGQAWSALSRLPSLVLQEFRGRLTEWIMKSLANNLQKHAQEFIRAADDTSDGVTITLTLENPPGFRQFGEAIRGKGVSLANLKVPEGEPTVKISIYPGRKYE